MVHMLSNTFLKHSYIMLSNHYSAEGYACHLCIIYLMCFAHDSPASRKLLNTEQYSRVPLNDRDTFSEMRC